MGYHLVLTKQSEDQQQTRQVMSFNIINYQSSIINTIIIININIY